jgi:hypothetical protein
LCWLWRHPNSNQSRCVNSCLTGLSRHHVQ